MSQTDEAPRTEAIPGAGLRWWTELPLILLVYGAYTAGRLLARGDVSQAVDHGLAILRAEKAVGLNLEHPLNRLFTREPWLGVPADFWYASFHYLVTPIVLVWLFRRRAEIYRTARTWLMTSTMIGLIGFILVPTCPPRLLAAGHGFVDTMAYYSSYGWWGGAASAPKGMGGLTNQYAAMPSLHVGWALWCGVMLWRHGRSPLLKAVGIAYPLLTTVIVMGTANHYFFDALAGVAAMAAGLLLTKPVRIAAARVREWAHGLVAGTPVAPSATPGPIVSGECQTASGERIPRQRKAATSHDSGDGAAAPAR
ncbi:MULTISPECIES: phosphatase PAP2 family protein [unclassified Streptomyces]|uniref:phosphatase PAP2 family protein n=1 Tax=unclassified Streptomyces TaxID=2593676 RepID=UPI00278BD3D2|nr:MULTISPECIES: phosphatase PAP2 family protein [unclassified Streptomyces]